MSPDGAVLTEQHYSGVREVACKERRHRHYWSKSDVWIGLFRFGSTCSTDAGNKKRKQKFLENFLSPASMCFKGRLDCHNIGICSTSNSQKFRYRISSCGWGVHSTVSHRIILRPVLWLVDPLQVKGREISNYTRAVAKYRLLTQGSFRGKNFRATEKLCFIHSPCRNVVSMTN
jgi:hypothetical protein